MPDKLSEPVVAIVVAAGSGSRLGNSIAGGLGPKALRQLAGRPLFVWSVEAMIAGGATHVVTVGPADHLDEVRAMLGAHGLADVTVVAGGAERQDSVARGIEAAPESDVILVHDAARPLVPAEVVARVIRAVRDGAPAVIPVIPVVDTVREITGTSSRLVDRSLLRAVQTPQGFLAEELAAAHASAPSGYTDDAAVCEAAGLPIMLVEGSPRAFKITTPVDFLVAEALIQEA